MNTTPHDWHAEHIEDVAHRALGADCARLVLANRARTPQDRARWLYCADALQRGQAWSEAQALAWEALANVEAHA